MEQSLLIYVAIRSGHFTHHGSVQPVRIYSRILHERDPFFWCTLAPTIFLSLWLLNSFDNFLGDGWPGSRGTLPCDVTNS